MYYLLFILIFYIEKEKIEPYMRNITLTCLKVLIDEKCDEIDENFKREVGKFIKNCIMTGGE
jgi:predicted P-loop ATPase